MAGPPFPAELEAAQKVREAGTGAALMGTGASARRSEIRTLSARPKAIYSYGRRYGSLHRVDWTASVVHTHEFLLYAI